MRRKRETGECVVPSPTAINLLFTVQMTSARRPDGRLKTHTTQQRVFFFISEKQKADRTVYFFFFQTISMNI